MGFFKSLLTLFHEATSSDEQALITILIFVVVLIVYAAFTFVTMRLDEKIGNTSWGEVVMFPLIMLGFGLFLITLFALILAIGSVAVLIYSLFS